MTRMKTEPNRVFHVSAKGERCGPGLTPARNGSSPFWRFDPGRGQEEKPLSKERDPGMEYRNRPTPSSRPDAVLRQGNRPVEYPRKPIAGERKTNRSRRRGFLGSSVGFPKRSVNHLIKDPLREQEAGGGGGSSDCKTVIADVRRPVREVEGGKIELFEDRVEKEKEG